MGSIRKKYDNEFRREAIRLSSQAGVSRSQIERELGLYQGAISRWKRELETNAADAFPGNGNLGAEKQEVYALRKELERVKQVCIFRMGSYLRQ